jgi:hypothetical protein
MSTAHTHTLDVRAEIRSGGNPFSRILQTVATLGSDDELLLLAPFEPVPLFRVMASQGFKHAATALPSGDWEVRFTRGLVSDCGPDQAAAPRSQEKSCGCAAAAPVGTVDVDTRGLEPPQPLVKILETVATLPENVEIRARTNRRPMHLYPELEARGFIGTSEEQPDGTFITHIRRR